MLFEDVKFAKFSINPDEIMASLPQYRQASWPVEWTIVAMLNGDVQLVIKWLIENATSAHDVHMSDCGKILVGFQDITDATLFKLSYMEQDFNGFI